jgi:hypothetical protein
VVRIIWFNVFVGVDHQLLSIRRQRRVHREVRPHDHAEGPANFDLLVPEAAQRACQPLAGAPKSLLHLAAPDFGHWAEAPSLSDVRYTRPPGTAPNAHYRTGLAWEPLAFDPDLAQEGFAAAYQAVGKLWTAPVNPIPGASEGSVRNLRSCRFGFAERFDGTRHVCIGLSIVLGVPPLPDSFRAVAENIPNSGNEGQVSGSWTAIFVPRSLTSMRKSTGSLPMVNA